MSIVSSQVHRLANEEGEKIGGRENDGRHFLVP